MLKDLVNRFSKFGASSSRDVVGLDIGGHSIKAAVLTKGRKGRYKVKDFIERPLPEACITDGEIQNPDALIRMIKATMGQLSVRTNKVVIGLSGQSAVTKRLEIPPGSKEETADNVLWEAEQFIPFSIDDAEISHDTIGTNEGGGQEVIMAAVKRDALDSYIEVCEDSDLNVQVVDLNVFALGNVFECAYKAKLNALSAGTMVLDFGAHHTKAVIFKGMGVYFSKEMPLGCANLSEQIQQRMGVSFDEAEDLKIHGDGSGGHPEEVMAIINDYLESLLLEIRKTLNFFINASSKDHVSNYLICGGGSYVPGLQQGLEDILGVSVDRLGLGGGFELDKKVSKGPMGAKVEQVGVNALGLAMRGHI